MSGASGGEPRPADDHGRRDLAVVLLAAYFVALIAIVVALMLLPAVL